MGGGRNGRFWGAPILHLLWKSALFSRVLAKNRGAPKTAVPTTTHPIPHLTPSEVGVFWGGLPSLEALAN